MIKNIVIGILISGVFVYLAFRGIDFSELAVSFQSANYAYMFPVVLAVLLSHYLRCFRWGVILDRLVHFDQKKLFVIGSIGFMAVGMLPARLGEFARPYLVKQSTGTRMTATMATIVVERIFDMLSLMLLMFIVLLKTSLPPIITRTGLTALAGTLVLFLVLVVMAVKREFSQKTIERLLGVLPSRAAGLLERLVHSFLDGLQILPDIKKTVAVGVLSLVIWLVLALSNYLLFFSFGFDLTIVNAFAVLVIVALGVMIPAAPGFVGTFHFACVLGLTTFGVGKSEALSFAIVIHFLQMVPVLTLGLIFLPFQKISLPGFIKREEEELEREGLDP